MCGEVVAVHRECHLIKKYMYTLRTKSIFFLSKQVTYAVNRELKSFMGHSEKQFFFLCLKGLNTFMTGASNKSACTIFLWQNQLDAQFFEFIEYHSACFGRPFRPSLLVKTVHTASDICHTG